MSELPPPRTPNSVGVPVVRRHVPLWGVALAAGASLVAGLVIGVTISGGDNDDTETSPTDATLVPASTSTVTTVPVTTVPVTEAATTTSTPEALEITGTFTLTDSETGGRWSSCFGTGGYDDFGAGMNVTVRSQNDTVIGSSSTRHLTATDPGAEEAQDAEFSCTVAFSVEVEESDFYLIDVGRRGQLSYSFEELESADWSVALTLG